MKRICISFIIGFINNDVINRWCLIVISANVSKVIMLVIPTNFYIAETTLIEEKNIYNQFKV